MDWIAFYHASAEQIVRLSGGSDKLVHVHAGLSIYLATQVVLRDRRSSRTALQAVAVLELLNECMDRLFWGSWRWMDTGGDVAATLLWPTAFYLVGRYRRARWASGQLSGLSLDADTRSVRLSPQRA